MPDASLKSYNLSEFTKIIEVDEKTLHLFAHKGLLNPALLADNDARFTDVDCARLKMIKRANDIGYQPEDIFRLIGNPEEVLEVEDPVSACQQYAKQKYKEIFEELNDCEPLEQLNKKCDLKLLKNYINQLDGRKLEPIAKRPTKKIQIPGLAPQTPQMLRPSTKLPPAQAPRTIPSSRETETIPASRETETIPSFRETRTIPSSRETRTIPSSRKTRTIPSSRETRTIPAAKKAQTMPDPPPPSDEKPMAEAKVLSYSVDKLWDYVKKTDGQDDEWDYAKKPDVQEEEPFESKFQEEAPPYIQEEAPPYIREKAPPYINDNETFQDTHSETFSASPHLQRVIGSRWWSTGQKGYRKIVDKPAWRNWAFSILVLALAITGLVRLFIYPTEKPLLDFTRESEVTDQQQDTAPVVPPTKDDQTVAESVKPEDKQAAEQQQAPPAEQSAQSEPSTQVPATAEKAEEAPPEVKETPSEGISAGVVKAKDMSLWHDSLKNIYRADFTIYKNPSAKNFGQITGYAFVHLEANDDEPAVTRSLLLPRGEIVSGIPSVVDQGAKFSIRNLIKISIKTNSNIQPDRIRSGKLLVYSPEGELMLEESLNVTIQPFFTVAEDTTTPEKDETADAAPPEPQPTQTAQTQQTPAVKPTPTPVQKPPVQSPVTASPTEAAEPQKRPGDMAAIPPRQKPTAPPEPTSPAETPATGTKLRRTDHPDAAIWEQKSYDAAVKGLYDRAIANASKAIKLDPGRVNPYINRSWSYIEKGMFQNAIKDCKTALALDPNNKFAYNNMGLAHERSNKTDQAKNDYRKACDLGLDLGCQNLNSLTNQTRITELLVDSKKAFKTKNWDSVVRATTEVIKLDPKNSVAYTNRSAAYAQMNFLVKALKDSNEAIKLDDKFSLAYNNRGYVFELLGNNRKAAADYLKSCSLGLNLGCVNFDKLN